MGGLVSYGIGHIHSHSLMSWQLIFLILGAVTSAYAIVLYLLLPDSPANALFLKKQERAIAIQRTLENKTGILDAGKFQTKQVLLALRDPQAWLLVTYMLCVNLCNGGITTVSPLSPNTSGHVLKAPNTDVHKVLRHHRSRLRLLYLQNPPDLHALWRRPTHLPSHNLRHRHLREIYTYHHDDSQLPRCHGRIPARLPTKRRCSSR